MHPSVQRLGRAPCTLYRRAQGVGTAMPRRELQTLLEHCREAIRARRKSIAPRHDQPDLPNLLCGAAAHGQQLGGRNRLATLVVTITTHIGVTGLASYHRYRRIGHVHWITSKHWTESVYSHSFGSREMSEL